jgi:UDP-N-acetylglucosamine diphosphorylase/glucosamine-1-phosphate N-acetyltransferase
MDTHVVILAAGKGTRMKSARSKVLHRVAGKPLIEHVLACAAAVRPQTITLVVGHQAEALTAALAGYRGLTFVVQEPQLGTAHALMTAEQVLAGQTGLLVLLSGDVPLLTAHTLERLIERHQTNGAAATVITAVVDEPRGYGRIVRSGDQIARIVEEKDASPAEQAIHEINSGIYAFTLEGLFDAVRGIAAHNAQREYYHPDLVAV